MSDNIVDINARKNTIINVPPERWVHRLILKNTAGPTEKFTPGCFDSSLGTMARVIVHDQVIESGYFLSEYRIIGDGEAASFSFDFYDLEGIDVGADDDEAGQSDQQSESADNEGGNEEEGDSAHKSHV